MFSSAAHAAHLTFVAANGNDTRPCTAIGAPCLTLQRAVNVTDAGGEVRVLSPLVGGATIRKSLTISGDDVPIIGRIVISQPGITVTLRGLALNGRNALTNGILISNAAAVHIDNCTVQRFTQNGIQLDAAAELFVIDSIARDNGDSGLDISGDGAGVGHARLTVDNSRFANNGSAGIAVEDTDSNITRTIVSGNVTQGILQGGQFGGRMHVAATSASDNGDGFFVTSGHMLMESAIAEGNQFNGLFVGQDAAALISNSTFTDNQTGVHHVGVVATRNNNSVTVNTTNDQGAGAVNSFTPF
jgi:hypothetical protein